MKKNYDFTNGVKNPYAEKMKKGYSVTIHYDFKPDTHEDTLETKQPEPKGEQASKAEHA